uniref:Uncharacterized protein n=1 Tax=uncultured marine bacterium Ant29B7 TaxID=360426 RepID=Q2PY61_9BACT|nr:hypothetical protein [uncultured marine bacterium Ant29B7]
MTAGIINPHNETDLQILNAAILLRNANTQCALLLDGLIDYHKMQ